MVSPTMGALLNKLSAKGKLSKSGSGYLARCPAHDDHDPSLSVTEEGGKILLHCHANCSNESITAALGITMADLFTERDRQHNAPTAMPIPFPKRPAPGETLVAVYEYTDLTTGAVAEKGRFELPEVGPDGKHKKTFRWRWKGNERWSGGVELSSLALWGHELVAAAPPDQTIYFVEGEKAAAACRAAGLIAVTHGGGASTKEFGASLEVLRGRKVALWPDNDGTGREYMATVHARLRGIASRVSVVTVPLPPKGDAHDYFQSGGTVEALESGAVPADAPSVELLPDDGIGVRLSTPLGLVRFTFTEIESGRGRAFHSKVSVTVEAPGIPAESYTEDIDLNSNSQVDKFRLSLDKIYGKDFNWTRLVNTIFNLARDHYLTYDRSVDAFDITPLRENDLFFHDPLIPANHITILFGDRGSVKSYIVYNLAFCTAMGEPFLGYTMPIVPVLVVDYEDNENNFRRRIDRLAQGLNLPLLPGVIHYIHVMGTPATDLVASIRRKVVKDGIGLVIVDSLGPATGGKPEDAKLAIDTMQALRKLGVTVVALAHVPKNHGEQPKDPFGSVFYSNLSRRTWYIERVQDEASDYVDVGLFCKKVNDGPLPRPIALSVSFDGLNGPVRIQQGRMAEVPALQEQRDMKYRLWDALEHGRTRTAVQLAAELNADVKEVMNTLARNPKMFVVVGEAKGDKGRPAHLWGQAARAA